MKKAVLILIVVLFAFSCKKEDTIEAKAPVVTYLQIEAVDNDGNSVTSDISVVKN